MGTSPDVGGARGMGRPQELQYQELDQTAQVQVLKQGVGMVETLLELPLNMVGGERYEKYKSDPSKPTLDTKVLSAIRRPDKPKSNPAEQKEFQRLADELPLQLSLELEEERKKPPLERDPKFIVFELILQFAAKALVWLDEADKIDPAFYVSNNAKIQAFSYATLRGWVANAEDIIAVLQSLAAAGNHSLQERRDAGTNAEILLQFATWAKVLLKAKKKPQQKILKKFKKDLLLIRQQIKTKKIQGILQVTQNLIENLVDHIGTFEKENSSAALIAAMKAARGYRLPLALDPVIKIIAAQPELSRMQTIFAPSLMKFAALFFPVLSLAASGKHKLGKKQDMRVKKEYIQSLALRLGMGLIAHSEIISLIACKLFKTVDVPEKEVNNMAAITDALAMAAIPLSSGEKPELVIRGVKKKLSQRFDSLREDVQEKELAPSIRQADIALKSENITGFFEAVKRMIRLAEREFDDVQKECLATVSLSFDFIDAIYEAGEIDNFTSVIHQIA